MQKGDLNLIEFTLESFLGKECHMLKAHLDSKLICLNVVSEFYKKEIYYSYISPFYNFDHFEGFGVFGINLISSIRTSSKNRREPDITTTNKLRLETL
jgi:hypothetical protein